MFNFENANPRQREAISTSDGPINYCGAGYRKTYTLVQRTLYLIEELGIQPENIFIATFTEKAAKELVTRISNTLDCRNVNIKEMYIGTFHSLCLRFLKEHLLTYSPCLKAGDSSINNNCLPKQVLRRLL